MHMNHEYESLYERSLNTFKIPLFLFQQYRCNNGNGNSVQLSPEECASVIRLLQSVCGGFPQLFGSLGLRTSTSVNTVFNGAVPSFG